jgi:thiol-disulfide isomerase/thioredoxin
MKLIDRIANIALIIGVAVFLFIVIRGDFVKQKRPNGSPKTLIGTSVSLPGIPLSETHNSLLVVISTKCHFCKDSLPFYKELITKTHGKIDVVAISPDPVTEMQTFLQEADVSAAKIASIDLAAIGITGTPTLLLVNGSGRVLEQWQGMLDERGRQKVLARILQ